MKTRIKKFYGDYIVPRSLPMGLKHFGEDEYGRYANEILNLEFHYVNSNRIHRNMFSNPRGIYLIIDTENKNLNFHLNLFGNIVYIGKAIDFIIRIKEHLLKTLRKISHHRYKKIKRAGIDHKNCVFYFASVSPELDLDLIEGYLIKMLKKTAANNRGVPGEYYDWYIKNSWWCEDGPLELTEKGEEIEEEIEEEIIRESLPIIVEPDLELPEYPTKQEIITLSRFITKNMKLSEGETFTRKQWKKCYYELVKEMGNNEDTKIIRKFIKLPFRNKYFTKIGVRDRRVRYLCPLWVKK